MSLEEQQTSHAFDESMKSENKDQLQEIEGNRNKGN